MLGTLFFDKQDRELLRMINETIDHGPSQDLEHKVFDANLHPHGILELTTTHEYRMAHAVINLLGNLEAGGAPDRLMACASSATRCCTAPARPSGTIRAASSSRS